MSAKSVLAVDLGTGGVKVCAFSADGRLLASAFEEYATYYPTQGLQEQRPQDWWRAIVRSVNRILAEKPALAGAISAIGVSGQSLGVVALRPDGELSCEYTPIWCDARASSQAETFFGGIDRDEWYLATGAGFPSGLYSLFKLMWYRERERALYDRTQKFIGSKDYINYRLTGRIATDYSYASGSGAYRLKAHGYDDAWLSQAGIDRGKLPEILPSDSVLGPLTADSAALLGLRKGIPVVAGGVDNACMALGAGCHREGSAYTSLGTSAWVAVSSAKPIVDLRARPYVFEHCVPGQYVSATCIFSAGGAFRWVRDTLCQSLKEQSAREGADVYDLMTALAARSPIGANGVLFDPSLSGGGAGDGLGSAKGCFIGLDASHTLGDLIRASMEGISLHLRIALDALSEHVEISNRMLLVGGGAKSALWRQIFADCFCKTILSSAVGQDAGALGAAALAARGAGLSDGLELIRTANGTQSALPPAHPDQYERLLALQKALTAALRPVYGHIIDRP